MKYLFLVITLFVGVATTHAQTSTPTSTPATPVQERLADRQQNRQDRPAALSDQSQKRIINLAANLSNRFDSVIDRLLNIHDRLNARLTILETEGQDVREARGYLTTAKTSLDVATANMSDIDTLVAAFATAPNPRAAWTNVRKRYTDTRELVRSAHADLRAAIQAVKDARLAESNQEVVE